MSGHAVTEPPRPQAALGAAVGLLAAANVVRSTVVPDALHLAFNVATGGAVLALGRRARLSWDDLGLGAGRWRRGLAFGAVAGGAVLAAIAVGSLLPAADDAFDDDRAAIGGAELVGRALVVIPVGTVLVEEIAFRGVVLALAQRATTPARAAALTAGLFGLWHVLPSWLGDGPAVAGGTLVATTVAGLGFGWLRTRSGSLLAPVLAHTATNSGALVAAWIAGR